MGGVYSESTAALIQARAGSFLIRFNRDWAEAILKNADRALRLNVGFLLSAGAGYSRNFPFDEPFLQLGEDLPLENLRGSLRLTRTHQGIYVQGQLEAHTLLQCVSCLSDYSQALRAQLADLFVYPPPNPADRILEVGEDHYLDLRPLVRESMLLEVPIRALCRPDCKGLCPICGADRNQEVCQHPDQDIDPRFSALRSLLNKESQHLGE